MLRGCFFHAISRNGSRERYKSSLFTTLSTHYIHLKSIRLYGSESENRQGRAKEERQPPASSKDEAEPPEKPQNTKSEHKPNEEHGFLGTFFGFRIYRFRDAKKKPLRSSDTLNEQLKSLRNYLHYDSSNPTTNKENAASKNKESSKDATDKKKEETNQDQQPKEEKRDNYSPRDLFLTIGSMVTAYFIANFITGLLTSSSAPVEISFQEFLNSENFKQGHVDRCLVSADRTQVFVFLKETSPDLRRQGVGSSRGTLSDEVVPDDPFRVVDTQDSAESTRTLRTPHLWNKTARPHYVFTIGSLESFERAMDAAQSSLYEAKLIASSGGGGSSNVSVEEASVLAASSPRIPITYALIPSPGPFTFMVEVAGSMLPIALLLLLLRSAFGSRGGAGGLSGLFNITKSKARLYNAEKSVKISFKDVAGMDEAKEEVVEFVKFLKEPKVYEALGAKIPKGAILSGPPGTGKTLLAKAIAGEAGVPFFSVSGSEFVEMFVGLGSSRVRDLFSEAKKHAPSIIFIDEIDAIGRTRGRSMGGGANDERESTLNQLLVEMDGFDTNQHVIVLAGTNRPDVLDAALTRPGRFDRQIRIDRPDVSGRKDIYLVHLKPIRIDPKGPSILDLATRLAYMTPGFAGADIANVCNEAALIAARFNATLVTERHLEAAVERITTGIEKKSRVLSEEERNIVAHHEAGHVTAAWFLKHANPVMKVTIIPRTSGALGFARTLPSDDYLVSREQLLDRVCVTLGGRVAEEIFFKEITSGAQNDLQKVTQWAYDSISVLGMDEKIGPVSFVSDEQRSSRNPFAGDAKMYSEATAQLIDERARAFIMTAHSRTTQLLSQHKDAMKKLAVVLLERETIHREDIETILGPRPFPNKHAYDEFVMNEKNPRHVIGPEEPPLPSPALSPSIPPSSTANPPPV